MATLRTAGNLCYASEQLRSDTGVVTAAVRLNGYALRYASEQLRADRDVIVDAVENTIQALRYCTFSCITREGIAFVEFIFREAHGRDRKEFPVFHKLSSVKSVLVEFT